jgi:hypothetical protein
VAVAFERAQMFHSFFFWQTRKKNFVLFFRETKKLQIYLFILTGGLTKDLREYLTTRFAKGSVDHELQTTIRDNLYLRTVPVTTRPRRPGETDGLDYTFLSLEQFRLLEKNGSLLERGIYDGKRNSPPPTPHSAIDNFCLNSSATVRWMDDSNWHFGLLPFKTLYRWN